MVMIINEVHTAFTLYDWCISLSREARVFWKVPSTLAAFLYHTIRWSMALDSIFVVAPLSSYSVKVRDTAAPITPMHERSLSEVCLDSIIALRRLCSDAI